MTTLSLMRNSFFICCSLACGIIGCAPDDVPTQVVTGPANVDDSQLSNDAAQRPGVDWPQFLGPTADGKSPETGILTDWSQGKLRTIWAREVGSSYGIGSVADSRYFQLDRVGASERLLCLRAATGEVVWESTQPVEYIDTYGYNDGPRSSPAIDGHRVYTYGVAGRLTCRDVKRGKLHWTHDLNKEFGVVQNFFGVGCSPVIYDDLVIVIVGGSPSADASLPLGRLDLVRPNGSALVAFDKKSGKERWRCGDHLASYSTPVAHSVGGQDLLLAFVRGGLLACTPQGEQRWFFPWRAPRLESVNAMVPVRRGDEVFISECYDIGSALLKMEPDAVEPLWTDPEERRKQAFRAHWATPIEVDGYLYGCSGRNEPDADLRCIRWSDGKLMWKHETRSRSSLLQVDGHFVVLDERGQLDLIRIDPQQRVVVTSLDLSEPSADGRRPGLTPPCWAAPILSHGRLYVRGRDHIVCLDLIPQ